MVAVSNIMVTICIMFSVPILHYPCRFSLWNLLHQMVPRFVPVAFDNGNPSQDYKLWKQNPKRGFWKQNPETTMDELNQYNFPEIALSRVEGRVLSSRES